MPGLESGPDLQFVVHKHKATSLHYDFRLEILGKMPSWSVPKGPSLDNEVKRLAMPTGDHALEYRNFEGVIPRGEYGAGPVMIWDNGTYDPEIEINHGRREQILARQRAEEVASEGLRYGNLKFFLHGMKLRGSFALVRTGGLRGKDSWLMMKHRDEYVVPGYDAADFDFSAVTGRSMAEIEASQSQLK
jgi:bifunctional non-homologous end joining protein LigD